MAQRKIVHIDELCQECGYFANNEPDTHNGHDYGCNHPDNIDGGLLCVASSCPLGCLAEAYHFEEIIGMSHDEALQWDNESSCVVIDDVEIEIELQH